MACAPVDPTPSAVASEATEDVELAPIMGEMQRHSAKLGYSIQARNQPLATFYLEELDEVLEELLAIPAHDGVPIAQPSQIIAVPALQNLEGKVKEPDWAATEAAYTQFIDSCNRCHAATEHEFIKILEPEGPPPYNQRF